MYHSGEIAMQERVGVRLMASRIGHGIYSIVPSSAAMFLLEHTMVFIGGEDAAGHVWASPLTGEAGFISAVGESTIRLTLKPDADDPLHPSLNVGASVGLLIIDFATRRRMRVNGYIVQRMGSDLLIATEQVYSNCQKYIQRRDSVPSEAETNPTVSTSSILSPSQQALIRGTDTLLIASSHPEGGIDVSHRGGEAGFVHVLGDTRLKFPDYAGNMMFNTLGNLIDNPAAGLLFLDHATGSTLQLTGLAEILWGEDEISEFAGAERVISFTVQSVVEIVNRLSFRWSAPEASPFNPT